MTARTSWAALALDRFLGDESLAHYVRVFGAFDVRDEAGGLWEWLATAKPRSVIAWCRRCERADWRLPSTSDMPWMDGARGA